MSFINKLRNIKERHGVLGEKLMAPESMDQKEYAATSKEYANLGEIMPLVEEYIKLKDGFTDLEEMAKGGDAELRELAEEDLRSGKKRVEELDQELKIALLPKDEDDDKNAIIEIRAGTGGDEAALFAANLFRMYQRFAEKMGWKLEILEASSTGLDGYKEISASISGKNVFAKLKFESGVHRVQRVPETESSGRIHTSAATVAVLPEAEEVDIDIEEKDLRIDVYRASGAGGQHVNTTDSAVRITHIPTGTVVCCQDEKSQHKNKAKAMKILRARIYENERHKRESEMSAMRKGMVGSGDRSERIRTYNYPQSRVTDHRINMTKYNLDEVITQGYLDEFIDALTTEDQAAKLAEQSSG
jgi:peptide chain release factor 1